MSKDRYGCTNHNKRILIDELDGNRCGNRRRSVGANSKTGF